MVMFSLDESPEYLELKRQVQELKEELLIAKKSREIFYREAKIEHDQVVRLKAENSQLRAKLYTITLNALELSRQFN